MQYNTSPTYPVSWINLHLASWATRPVFLGPHIVLSIWVRRTVKVSTDGTHPELVLYAYVLFLSHIPLAIGRLK